tara:strand:- start:17 stop:199 length:183 start_codon:yes stop_codon:yes gene_type:complete
MTPSDKQDLQRTITQQRERIDLLTAAIQQLQSDATKILDLIKSHDQQQQKFKQATPEDGL